MLYKSTHVSRIGEYMLINKAHKKQLNQTTYENYSINAMRTAANQSYRIFDF